MHGSSSDKNDASWTILYPRKAWKMAWWLIPVSNHAPYCKNQHEALNEKIFSICRSQIHFAMRLTIVMYIYYNIMGNSAVFYQKQPRKRLNIVTIQRFLSKYSCTARKLIDKKKARNFLFQSLTILFRHWGTFWRILYQRRGQVLARKMPCMRAVQIWLNRKYLSIRIKYN